MICQKMLFLNIHEYFSIIDWFAIFKTRPVPEQDSSPDSAFPIIFKNFVVKL